MSVGRCAAPERWAQFCSLEEYLRESVTVCCSNLMRYNYWMRTGDGGSVFCGCRN
jgi:hypothetical protein